MSAPSLSSVVFIDDSVNVNWKAIKGCSGYEIQISTDATFKKNIINEKAEDDIYLCLAKNGFACGVYYARIRTYKTVDGKKIYSSYSSVKSIKVK